MCLPSCSTSSVLSASCSVLGGGAALSSGATLIASQVVTLALPVLLIQGIGSAVISSALLGCVVLDAIALYRVFNADLAQPGKSQQMRAAALTLLISLICLAASVAITFVDFLTFWKGLPILNGVAAGLFALAIVGRAYLYHRGNRNCSTSSNSLDTRNVLVENNNHRNELTVDDGSGSEADLKPANRATTDPASIGVVSHSSSSTFTPPSKKVTKKNLEPGRVSQSNQSSSVTRNPFPVRTPSKEFSNLTPSETEIANYQLGKTKVEKKREKFIVDGHTLWRETYSWKNFDRANFQAQCAPSYDQKKKVLELTISNIEFPDEGSVSLVYSESDDSALGQLVEHSNDSQPTKVQFKSGFFTYDTVGETIDYYALYGAHTLGGGVFRNGFVQEERIVCECTTALLIYLGNFKICLKRSETANGNEKTVQTPVLIGDHRLFEIDNKVYGSTGLAPVPVKDVPSKITRLETAQPINLFSILAIKFKNEGNSSTVYTEAQLQSTYQQAYCAFIGAKKKSGSAQPVRINTGNWGCGDFQNSVSMMVAIQYLAARAAGIEEIVFHDIGSEFNAEYTEEAMEKVITEVNEQINSDASVNEILIHFQNKQNAKEEWSEEQARLWRSHKASPLKHAPKHS